MSPEPTPSPTASPSPSPTATPGPAASAITLAARRIGAWRLRATGRLTRKDGATIIGCTGRVTLRLRAGSRPVATRTAALSSACAFALRMKLTRAERRRVRAARTLILRARFPGSATLTAAQSQAVRVRR